MTAGAVDLDEEEEEEVVCSEWWSWWCSSAVIKRRGVEIRVEVGRALQEGRQCLDDGWTKKRWMK